VSAGGADAADGALQQLAELLRGDEVLAQHVREPSADPSLGRLVASGPRAAEAPGEYALLFEAIREGFLLHYEEPRLLEGADPDLRLLAGDYLYALGLERLAARGDVSSVRELGDLISLSAQLHARDGDGASEAVDLLWLASAVAVGGGPADGYERAKREMREGGPKGLGQLAAATTEAADRSGMRTALAGAADSIGFAQEHLFDRG
jgi:hypothetical protein